MVRYSRQCLHWYGANEHMVWWQHSFDVTDHINTWPGLLLWLWTAVSDQELWLVVWLLCLILCSLICTITFLFDLTYVRRDVLVAKEYLDLWDHPAVRAFLVKLGWREWQERRCVQRARYSKPITPKLLYTIFLMFVIILVAHAQREVLCWFVCLSCCSVCTVADRSLLGASRGNFLTFGFTRQTLFSTDYGYFYTHLEGSPASLTVWRNDYCAYL